MSFITKKSLFILFFLSFYLLDATKVVSSSIEFTDEHEVQTVDNFPIKVSPGKKFTVYIINYLSKNSSTLYVHCASRDDDLGIHSLNPRDYFHWDFRLNFWQTTLFFCRFQSSPKIKMCDVFTRDLADNCETARASDGNNCVWSVKEDGFYISNRFPPTNSKKIYDWK
ncbi:hypothetical protein Pfo_018670 [Paulownia fortunei]|nr:hypothetical protein Pfo_018670 [Paulownia fortunei]